MSFDVELVEGRIALAEGLNPFGTGQCLSTEVEQLLNNLLMRLNPFGTGQCLSTNWAY